MSEWQLVYGTQLSTPTEFDTTSSSVIGYQRRNIKKVELEGTYFWEYEERTMPLEECIKLQKEELAKSSTTSLLAVTDLYEQLIKKGVL